ncbi:transmembrane protein 54a isoform X2 [Salvelinus namaycush]|uniref:Transmembrane protein 54a isoform X2 n=1 Tax=Salvelinus namaycush TaxID=8040 RepID=A0A8U1GVV2_SALNM|nr:transmembrane protein 54a isoform X2 [Salvelinus namaycush]
MGNLGVCCADLKDNKTLMKMGLGLVLVGHVNFLLGALVHGVVLRHINVHVQARVMGYAIYIIIALVAGLVMWALLVVSLVSGLLAIASTVGLTISMVKAIMSGGRGLLKNCKFPDAIGYSSVNECPFDPTRIYETTIILWVPLILMCVVEVVFSGRCFAVCTSFLRLCTCRRRRKIVNGRRVRIQTPGEMLPVSPTPESETESEPAEQHELLKPDSPTERSEWV